MAVLTIRLDDTVAIMRSQANIFAYRVTLAVCIAPASVAASCSVQNKLIPNRANCMDVLTTRFGETVAIHNAATCTESADV